MKYLTRNKIYTRVEPFREAKKVYIFCESEKGGIEVSYFNFFIGISSNLDLIPIPNQNGKSDPIHLSEHAEQYFKVQKTEFDEVLQDEVWFVIDTDHWNEGDKIEKLREFINQKNTKYKGWSLAQSNPCFEVWQFFHFHTTKPNEEEVKTFKSFKEFLNNKIPGGFDNRSMPVKIENAIKNAENNFELVGNQPSMFSTEVYLLAQKIAMFTKRQLDIILNYQK
jgi:hypothetical protein